jgi:disulfide bond formation protein DsbB
MQPARLRTLWPFATLAVSAALLAGAHAFESFGGLRPCMLCLQQRDWHWGVVAASAAAAALLMWRPHWGRPAVFAIALILAGSAYAGGYHVAVEQGWVIAQCDARIDPDDIGVFNLAGETDVPQCDEIAWSLAGISMAGYNCIISLLMALASFAIALWPERKS